MRRRSYALTEDERSVLLLVTRGVTNQEIADHLDMSLTKVKTLLHSVCSKTNARNRIEAAFFAIKQRAISVGETFSMDELAEMTASLGPDKIEGLAELLRQKLEQERMILPREEHPGTADGKIELTAGEKNVLILVSKGMTNQEIAERLCISRGAAKSLLHQACLKLKASRRGEAFIKAVRIGAISINEAFTTDELVELLGALGPDTLQRIAETMRKASRAEQR